MVHAFAFRQTVLVGVVFLIAAVPAQANQDITNVPAYVRENYTRKDYQIAMRDGVQLYTVVYAPKDKTQKHPILMTRTPYGVAPYAKDSYRASLGPSRHFVPEHYIFVYQDVRGCYMSEGTFVNMRPHLEKRKDKNDIDESTDTYDTIDWLIKNIDGHNGKVGLWGISYPGFYASAGMIDAHPALKAVSPQAPIADWFFDDFFHHGAFFLPHAFNFFSSFGQPRPKPTTTRPFRFNHPINDGYQFFLELGPLANANKKYFKNDISFWNEMMDHPNYDAFWQARNLLPHLKNCAPAVMTVGGWFDAEDLYGPLKTYAAVEKNNPSSFNVIVMGPWAHGGWSGGGLGNRLGNISFGSDTAAFFQTEIELPFFNHFLLGKGEHKLPEAYMFETGINKWRKFDQWPPKGLESKKVHFHAGGKLSFESVTVSGAVFDEYVSDPKKPVPYTEAFATNMTSEYMTDDQRFASKRPDVVVYQTDVLSENITFAGPIIADLRVSTSGTDSDWIVKVIDVYPQNAVDGTSNKPLAGYQMMVRSEVIRGRFRNSYEKPEPFKAGEPTTVRLALQDVLHTFPKGHRIMVQVCSSWFPLADRNPQKYVDNIFYAEEKDFIMATQRVYCSQTHPTALEVGVLTAGKN
jgi:putative CocE/NonD family hydrolase